MGIIVSGGIAGGATAIVGGQYGSEGKGVVAAALADQFGAAVRVGGPNAGHSFRVPCDDGTGDYRTYKMRGVPCAWVNPDAYLAIGPGAVVDPELLEHELAELPDDVKVFVDSRAAVVLPTDGLMERSLGMVEAIGSTTEGVGIARSRKIGRRGDLPRIVGEYKGPWPDKAYMVDNVSEDLYDLYRSGVPIMLEGTQGMGLSIDHGTEYPYLTSANVSAAALADQAGLPPSAVAHTFLVCRTLPIRVAGNSGPMHEELSWADLSEHAGVVTPERTTVTNKIRRIGRWDSALFERSVRLNEPCGVFLMFADYLVPELAGTRDADELLDRSRPGPLGDLAALTASIEDLYHTPVVAYGTGGDAWSLAFRGNCAHGNSWAPQR